MLNRCPSCQNGAIFKSFTRMNTECPSCGLVFAREPGYFTGAIVASYFMSCASLIPTLVICFFVLNLEFPAVVGISIAQLLILYPFIHRYSRMIWIAVEGRITKRLEARDRPRT
jgi:uncharacterized protein (DUF983 family)